MSSTSVQVAVKVRPLVRHEIEKGCKEIVDTVSANEQIVIKNCDKAFTFNYVLGAESPEEDLYNRCVAPLMTKIYQGIISHKVQIRSEESSLVVGLFHFCWNNFSSCARLL